MPDERLPPLHKFLPPPPDEFFAGLFTIVGELLKAPLRAGQAIAGSVDRAITEIETLPRRE